MSGQASIKFYLFEGSKKKGVFPIYMRITYARKKAEHHTGYTCTKKEWNEANQNTRNNSHVNSKLSDKKAAIYNFVSDLEKEKKPISAALLKDLLTGKAQVKVNVLDYLDNHIKEITLRSQIKTISLNKYKQSQNTLKGYIPEKYGRPDLLMDQVNYEFINGYDLYLKKTLNLHKNTINKYHSRLRTLLLKALAEGIISKQPYANFKLVTQKTDREFLSQEDLLKIVTKDLSHNKSLDKVRDLFVFSCYTGLRFQDAQNLTLENLTTYNKKAFLRFAQEKTGRAIDIPLLPAAKKILDKYKNEPERKILNKLLPKISNQKVNSYLKIIGDQAELNRTITHHMARHTFATTICLNNGMPMEDVSKLLGHSSLKTTAIYGRITQDRLQKSMERVNKKM
jgi:site-specific recombinase XerD